MVPLTSLLTTSIGLPLGESCASMEAQALRPAVARDTVAGVDVGYEAWIEGVADVVDHHPADPFQPDEGVWRTPNRATNTPSGSGPLFGLRPSSALLSWLALNSTLAETACAAPARRPNRTPGYIASPDRERTGTKLYNSVHSPAAFLPLIPRHSANWSRAVGPGLSRDQVVRAPKTEGSNP